MSRNPALMCPGCGRGIGPASDKADPTSTLPDGAVLACTKCLTIYLYDEGTWREPTKSERALLMTDERMVEMLSFQQEIALWQDGDRDRIRACVMPFLLSLLAHETTVDIAAGDMADALIAADFHTHPSEELMEAYASDE